MFERKEKTAADAIEIRGEKSNLFYKIMDFLPDIPEWLPAAISIAALLIAIMK
ncbi:hypothetical protein DesyoDRAFT_1100 [Desulfosporosinus youngiae DSM 17734]|uniref:Uncharacterized protein n=1 Tax=Desulfosporosinus youngiae DSM 17734 TaxID=768710 RepID=H5Y272_9FIRM|nr:hypothetical protein DesyoDRAFT_1100 [Desulfosporosinus youngiae DSM 17734]